MVGQKPEDVLAKAVEMIRDPCQWTRGARARNELGQPVHPADPTAVAWDMEAAVAMACNPYGILPPFFMVLLDEVAQEKHGTYAVFIAEDYRHEIVIDLLEAARTKLTTWSTPKI